MCEESFSPEFLLLIALSILAAAILDTLLPFEYTIGPFLAIALGLWMRRDMARRAEESSRAKDSAEKHLTVLTEKIKEEIKKHESS